MRLSRIASGVSAPRRAPAFFAVALGCLLLAAPACAAPRGRLYVRVGPPAPIVQVRAVAPGPNHVWVGGYQRWTGGRYDWVPGRWVMPPRPRAVWVPGRWTQHRRGWYWTDGRWR